MMQINKIKGFEKVLDIYFITKDGKVYSNKKEGYLNVTDNGHGYKNVSLKIKGERKWKKCYVHRLVALAYIPNNDYNLEVNHKDENKSNNNVENLEWITHKENNNYGTKKERMVKTRCKTVYVYDYKLNFIGEFLGVSNATKNTIGYAEPRALNRRVKDYFYLAENNLKIINEINKKSMYKSVVLENIITGQKEIFPTTRSLRDIFFKNKINVSDAIKYNWIVDKTYKIYELNYNELIDSPNLQEKKL